MMKRLSKFDNQRMPADLGPDVVDLCDQVECHGVTHGGTQPLSHQHQDSFGRPKEAALELHGQRQCGLGWNGDDAALGNGEVPGVIASNENIVNKVLGARVAHFYLEMQRE